MQSGKERASASQPYSGVERRRGEDRRLGSDRRREIRFELDKDDRRCGRDRRRTGGWDDAYSRY